MQQQPPAVGLATKVGLIVGALAGVLGPLSTVLGGDQTPEALGALGVAALAFMSVVLGRSYQAGKITEAAARGRRSEVQTSAAPTDVASVSAARAALGLGTAATQASTAPSDRGPVMGTSTGPVPRGVEFRDAPGVDDDDGGEALAKRFGITDMEPVDPSGIPPDVGDHDAVGARVQVQR